MIIKIMEKEKTKYNKPIRTFYRVKNFIVDRDNFMLTIYHDNDDTMVYYPITDNEYIIIDERYTRDFVYADTDSEVQHG